MKKPDFLKKIESYREEMVNDLYSLVRRRSVAGVFEEGAPFGRGVDVYKRQTLALS